MVQPSVRPYSIDADDPRAPTLEVWQRMTEHERQEVIEALPARIPFEAHPPEGDPHRKAKNSAVETLFAKHDKAEARANVAEARAKAAEARANAAEAQSKAAEALVNAAEAQTAAARAQTAVAEEQATEATVRIQELERELARLKRD